MARPRLLQDHTGGDREVASCVLESVLKHPREYKAMSSTAQFGSDHSLDNPSQTSDPPKFRILAFSGGSHWERLTKRIDAL